MVYRRIKCFDEAREDYNSMKKRFGQEEGFAMMKLIINLILLPLQKDRIKQHIEMN